MINPKTITTVLAVLIDIAATHAAETNGPVPNPAETKRPVLAIYTTQPKLGNFAPGPQIITAVWDDGRIVWAAAGPHPNPRLRRPPRSVDEAHVRGGPPHQEGRIPKEKLDELLRTLERQGVFSDDILASEMKRRRPGPDNWCTTIVIDRGGQKWEMQSWHEHFEQNTNLVVTAYSPDPLNGRSREAVLALQPINYQRFRKTWSEIRKAVAGLIPEKGEPFNGMIQIETK